MTTTKPIPPWQVKGVSEDTRRKIKAAAAMQGITIGQAVEEAIADWYEKITRAENHEK
jgi:hypothetical protein